MLFNLLGNAVAALEGAGEIGIAARRTRAPCPAEALVFGQCGGGEAIEIEIRDNGHGIAPDVLPRIFDPFFTTKEVGQGLGLGLFIVFEIVEEHGGCIAVTSVPGEGTTFILRFPPEKKMPSGNLLIVGTSAGLQVDGVQLMRLNQDGSLDTTFGYGGVAAYDFTHQGPRCGHGGVRTCRGGFGSWWSASFRLECAL